MRQLEIFNPSLRAVPIMPSEYKGKEKNPCGYTKTNPREWTEDELRWILKLKEEGYSLSEIAKSCSRSEVSISIKMKRTKKTDNSYNDDHINEKYEANLQYYNKVMPKTILDLYCGVKSWWKNNTNADVLTNDKDKSIKADYNEDAEYLIHKLYYERLKFDVIDIDPFGSGFECFDLAIKMAKLGVVITFGEYGHKRFKRLDFVKYHYGIETLDDFTIENMVNVVKQIALKNKKEATPIIQKKWNRIFRVYFTLTPIKITTQWQTDEILF